MPSLEYLDHFRPLIYENQEIPAPVDGSREN